MQAAQVLHAPEITPQAQEFLMKKRAADARIAAAAARRLEIVTTSAAVPELESTPEQETPPETPEQWAKRQIAAYEPWFCIESEIIPDGASSPRRPSVVDVQRAVARHYSVSRNDLLSACRTADIIKPRHIAMYLARQLTLNSLPQIGRKFAGRDHSTILSAVRKITRKMEVDMALSDEVESLRLAISEDHSR